MAGEPADVDDGPGTGLREVRQARLAAKERRVQDAADHPAPFLERNALERCLHAHGGVVDERIEAPEMLDRRPHQCGHFARRGDVGDVRRRLAAGFLDHGDGFLGLRARRSRVDHHCRTAGGERARDGAADVAGAARNQRNLAGELHAAGHADRARQFSILPSG